MFSNCQGIRSKHKELELYLKENNFDIVALNETFLTKKVDFKIQGYDTIKNDRSTGTRGGVAFLVKHGLVINKEYRNIDFNVITGNEALVIDIDLCNNQNLKLSTTFPTMSCLSAISIRSWKLSAVPRKTALVQCSKILKSSKPNLLKQ